MSEIAFKYEDCTITVSNGQSLIVFKLNPDTTPVMDDATGEVIGTVGMEEHALMIVDFQDEEKLLLFVSMLAEDPDTAFTNYMAQRNQ